MSMRQPLQALIVEDNPDDAAYVLEGAVEKSASQITWTHAETLTQALHHLEENTFDVMLLDLSLPESDGLQTFEAFRGKHIFIPTVVLTGLSGRELALKAIEMGAQDFLNKDEADIDTIIQSIQFAIKRSEHTRGGDRTQAPADRLKETEVIERVRLVIEDYILLETIGRGSCSQVYLAQKQSGPRTGDCFAFKLFRPRNIPGRKRHRLKQHFLKEAEITASVEHPFIVSIMETGAVEDLDAPYIVMEYVKGKPLEEIIKNSSALSASQKLQLIRQLTEALKAIHAKGICHNDIKPGNIMLKDDMSIRLMDFGVANVLTAGEAGIHEIVGTPLYMAPEAWRSRNTDFRSDIFSLGVLSYELLIGTYPFSGNNLYEITHSIREDSPPPPRRVAPGCPAAIERMLLKMLEKNPDRRYQDAHHITADIDAVMAERVEDFCFSETALLHYFNEGGRRVF